MSDRSGKIVPGTAVTNNQLSEKKNEPLFATLADFCHINMLTVADFKPPM